MRSVRTDTVRAKVSHETKCRAERVLSLLGLSMSDAINLLLIQIDMKNGLPFELVIRKFPNAETRKELEATDRGEGLVESEDSDDFFEKIGI